MIETREDETGENIDGSKTAKVFADLFQMLDEFSLSLFIRDSKSVGRKALRIFRVHHVPKGKE